MITRLYYEGHVTLSAPIVCEPQLEILVQKHGARLSKFAMLKDDEEPLGFISLRDQSLLSITTRMNSLCDEIEKFGWIVKRYKIEDTLHDTNHGDPFPWRNIEP